MHQLKGTAFTNFVIGAPQITAELNGQVYNAEEQLQILSEVQTSYYAIIVLSQFMHIWVCRTRTTSIFTHGFKVNYSYFKE